MKINQFVTQTNQFEQQEEGNIRLGKEKRIYQFRRQNPFLTENNIASTSQEETFPCEE